MSTLFAYRTSVRINYKNQCIRRRNEREEEGEAKKNKEKKVEKDGKLTDIITTLV